MHKMHNFNILNEFLWVLVALFRLATATPVISGNATFQWAFSEVSYSTEILIVLVLTM
jgi:hypothetical protein